MKMLWCWRCKRDVPMLDDEEFKRPSRPGEQERGIFGKASSDPSRESTSALRDSMNCNNSDLI